MKKDQKREEDEKEDLEKKGKNGRKRNIKKKRVNERIKNKEKDTALPLAHLSLIKMSKTCQTVTEIEI